MSPPCPRVVSPRSYVLCSLGAPYGWSAISAQLTREAGLVTNAAADWSLDLATYPMVSSEQFYTEMRILMKIVSP